LTGVWNRHLILLQALKKEEFASISPSLQTGETFPERS